MADDLAAALQRLPDDQLNDVHEQLVRLGATSKREGRPETGTFYATVLRSVQRETLRRRRLAASPDN